jgi:phosphoesterase RecJ-like protein
MKYALASLGKKVTVIKGDSTLPHILSFLPGYSEIVEKDYAEAVEEGSSLPKFDLFIILDSGSKELISRKSEVIFPKEMKTLVIDHHKTNGKYADVNLVDTSYAATAEYLFDLFNEWNIPITKDIAACLYIGIYGDTGGFRYSSTKPHTMAVVAKLTEIYPDFADLIQSLEYANPKEKILFDGLALNSIETFFEGTVAISSVSYEDLQKKGIRREDIENNTIASMMLTVKEWNIAVTLIEKASNEISISFRSKGVYDVATIAEKIGGGGHMKASGANLFMTRAEAHKKILDIIGQCYTL